jgi:hypothetical protein
MENRNIVGAFFRRFLASSDFEGKTSRIARDFSVPTAAKLKTVR